MQQYSGIISIPPGSLRERQSKSRGESRYITVPSATFRPHAIGGT
jgi:hypothetical protein